MKTSSLYKDINTNRIGIIIFVIGFLLITAPQIVEAKLITVGTASDTVSMGNLLGIGVTNPVFNLQVYGSGSNYNDGNIAVNPYNQSYPGILGRFQRNNDTAVGGSYYTYLANDMNHISGAAEDQYYVYNQYVDGQAITLNAEGFKFWYADATANGQNATATQLMRITNTGNVGIGLTNPGAKLDISGTLLNSLATTHSLLGGSGNIVVMADNTGALYATSTASLLSGGSSLWSGTLDGNIWNGTAGAGMVGIGTTAPNKSLTIGGSGTKAISRDNTSGNLDLYGGTDYFNGAYFKVTGNTTNTYPGNSSAEFTIGDYTGTYFSNFTVYSYNTSTSWTPRWTVIGSSGNVGMGMLQPQAKLEVGTVSDTVTNTIRVLSGDTVSAGFEAYGSSQGTGYLYVGQSAAYGGGLFYNGDGSPAFPATGESADRISFYRNINGVKEVVFSYPHYSNDVIFRGAISSPSVGTGSERFGASSYAAGSYTSVFGNGAETSASYSSVFGFNSSSTGSYSSAFGYNVDVSGNYSSAMGANTSVDGSDSIAIGEYSGIGSGSSRSISLGTDNFIGGSTSNTVLIGGASNTSHSNTFLLGVGVISTAANQVVIGANNLPKTDIYFGNGVYNAAPSNYTIHGTRGSGTNIAGGALQLAGGEGTGTGLGGSILFQTSPVGTTGSSVNSLATAMTIHSNGNVGIGVTDPGSVLSLRKDQDATTDIQITNTATGDSSKAQFLAWNGTVSAYFGVRSTTFSGWGEMDANDAYFTADDDVSIFTYVAGKAIKFGTGNGTPTERMRINDTGNVGIGTTAPAGLLHINDISSNNRIRFQKSATEWIDFNDGSFNDVQIDFMTDGSKHVSLGVDDTDDSFKISHSGTLETNTAFTINTSGNVGIGITNPGAKLDVAGTTKLGTAGGAFTAMGTCTIASTAISTTKTNYTCTGVPASTAVAVNCSGSTTQSGSGTLYCRATGTANQVACNTSATNTTAMTWTCMWVQP